MTKLDSLETKAIDAGAGYWVNKRTCELIEKDDLRALVGIARELKSLLEQGKHKYCIDGDAAYCDGEGGDDQPCEWCRMAADANSALAALEAPK